MPIYEFKCQNCHRITEKLLKMSEAYPATCEFCQKGPLHKLISPSGFVLKGSGWYATDFKSKAPISKSEKKSDEKESTESVKEPKPEKTEKTEKTEKKTEASTAGG